MADMLLCFAMRWYFCTYFASALLVVQEPSVIMETENVSLICSIEISVGFTPDWYLPDGTQATDGCTSNPALPYIDVICNSTGTINIYTLLITGAGADRDDGSYSCKANTIAIIGVNIHVARSIINIEPATLVVSEGNLYNVSGSTSCGYPTTVTWYKVKSGIHQTITDVLDYNDTCTAKLRNVTSIARFQGENVEALKFCVINTGDVSDRSTCRTIGVTYVSSTRNIYSTDDTTLPVSAAHTTTKHTTEASASGSTNSGEERSTGHSAANSSASTSYIDSVSDIPTTESTSYRPTNKTVCWCWCERHLTICIVICIVVSFVVIICICLIYFFVFKRKCKQCKKLKKDCKCKEAEERKGPGRARKTGDIPKGPSAASNVNTGNG